MKGRYQFVNGFATKLTTNYNLQIGVDGVLPLAEVPAVDEGKYFWLTLAPYDDLRRYVLRCYKEGGVVKYHGYDVTDNRSYNQNEDIIMADVAEYLNFLSENVDDIGFTVNRVNNGVLVSGGEIFLGDSSYVIADQLLTLDQFSEGVNYVYLDYTNKNFVVSNDPAWTGGWRVATVLINLGAVVSIVDDRWLRAPYNYDSNFFEVVDGVVTIKNNVITKDQIDLTTLTTDDIQEGTTNLYFTEDRVLNITEIQDTISKTHEHSNLDLLETYTFTNDTINYLVSVAHAHSNLNLLESYTYTNDEIGQAINKAHYHSNLATLNAIPNYMVAGIGTVLTRTATGLEWLPGGGGGGGGATYIPGAIAVRETFEGDGTSDTIVLSATPSTTASLFVFNDSGQRYFEGVDYTISGNVITLTHTPDTGRKIYVTYFVGDYGGYANASRDIFTGDGSTTVFYLTDMPANNNVVFVFNDSGQLYIEGIDYQLYGQELHLMVAPDAGRNIYVNYFTDDTTATNIYSMENLLGTGVGTYYQTVNNVFYMRRITGTGGITVYEDPTTHNIVIDGNVTGGTGGESNYGINVGNGAEVYKGKNGVALEFRTITTSDGVLDAIQTDDEIVLNFDEDKLNPRLYRHFLFSGF